MLWRNIMCYMWFKWKVLDQWKYCFYVQIIIFQLYHFLLVILWKNIVWYMLIWVKIIFLCQKYFFIECMNQTNSSKRYRSVKVETVEDAYSLLNYVGILYERENNFLILVHCLYFFSFFWCYFARVLTTKKLWCDFEKYGYAF